ncbi:MAG: TonB-dependent receptor, partial [Deltaproteobacteria bacterium]|nr:TonB-dependent receptor [Deltaproteobacteria bacterium]
PPQSTRLEWDRLNRLGLGGILDPRPQGRERKETLRLVHEDALSLGVQPGEFQLGWRLMGKEERLRRTDNLSLGALAEGYATLRHLDSGAWWEGHSAGHTLRLGAVLGRQNLEDKRFQARRTEAGLYAQWNHQQGAGVTEASVRGDTLNGGTTRTTGRLALSRMAWGGVGIKTSAATGYRPPSLYELYDPGSPGSGVSAANPGLLPERTRALDAGVFYEDEYRGYVEALRFRQEVREDILAVADPARPSLYRLDNVSRTQAMGWELTLSLRLPWGVEADGGWTRLEAMILDNARLDPRDAGHRVPGTAPLRWNAGLSWREGRWRTQYRIRYNGPRFVDTANTRYLKPYRLHEAGVSATLGGGWEVALNGRNLTNETFAEMENQPPPGRELLLTLRWGFGGDRLPASPPPMRAPRSGSATDALPSP